MNNILEKIKKQFNLKEDEVIVVSREQSLDLDETFIYDLLFRGLATSQEDMIKARNIADQDDEAIIIYKKQQEKKKKVTARRKKKRLKTLSQM